MKITDKNGNMFEGSADELKGFGFEVELQADEEVDGKTEVTTDFKVGDKVEVVGVSVSERDEFIGETAVITNILDDHYFQIDERGCSIYPQSSLKLIEEEPEVLSADNVKEGDYFVITGNKHEHNFTVGEVVEAKCHSDSTTFKAEHVDGSAEWYVLYTSVRRATAEEIAEATKPKEVKFEVGDVVKVGGSFAKVTSEVESDGECKIKRYKDGVWGYRQYTNLRHATEEEKSHLQTLIGREKYEYKVGDLVELLSRANSGYSGRNGYIFEVDSVSSSYYHLRDNGNKTNEMDTYIKAVDLKLITPVEWRHDFVKEAN